MGRQEDRLCGPAPSLAFVLDCDQVLNDDKFVIDYIFFYYNCITYLTLYRMFIFYAINHAFDLAELYVKRFEPIRINYDIDLNTDPKTIKAEKGKTLLFLILVG